MFVDVLCLRVRVVAVIHLTMVMKVRGVVLLGMAVGHRFLCVDLVVVAVAKAVVVVVVHQVIVMVARHLVSRTQTRVPKESRP